MERLRAVSGLPYSVVSIVAVVPLITKLLVRVPSLRIDDVLDQMSTSPNRTIRAFSGEAQKVRRSFGSPKSSQEVGD